MADDSRLVRLAFERGWLTRPQAESGRPIGELLSAEQIRELRAGQGLASRLLEQGFLRGEDLKEREPERFGRYAILRALGAGAGGRVYLARDPELGRDVAVKILDRGIMAQPERFRREMEILASLHHPNIVTIYDAGTQEGRPYYAMEYAEGRSLAEMKLPLRESVEVLEQVARACHAAHEKGIVHRDLKPANILFAGRPLVADFGIAKVADAGLTETGQTIGTPTYMSPEQARGEEVDPRSDVYSLGVLLYEAMTGRRPFAGPSALEVMRQVAEEDPVPPRAHDRSLPRDLEAVALGAMAKDPGRRTPTALAFAEDLRAWLEGRPVRARPPGLLRRMAGAVRRRRRLSAAAAALAIFLLAGLIFSASTAPRRRFEHLVHQEALRIQGWEVNLYKPARQISYAELEKAVGNLRPVLERGDLPASLRHEAHAAAARACLFMGRTGEAREHLDSAIALGGGLRIGEEHFERARLAWEGLLREQIARNGPEARRLADLVKEDFRSGLRSGFRDDWYRDLAAALLRLLEVKERGVAETIRDLDRLAEVPEKRSEEVAKFKGDVYLLLKDGDRAIEQFRKAVETRECFVQAYNGLALGFFTKGRGEGEEEVRQAIDTAFRAIDINPRYEDSYFLFALLCRGALQASPRELARPNPKGQELLERAIVKLRAGSRARPDSAAIRTAHGTACALLAFFLSAAGDPGPAAAEAVETLTAATGLDASRAEPWIALGAVLTLEGIRPGGKREALKKARESLERAREREPQNWAVHRWLGNCLAAAGDRPAASAALRRAVELNEGLQEELEPAIRELERRK
jgi:tetratricopeptide (TPR) repeat protein/predicted Ser/Thr protein kinase